MKSLITSFLSILFISSLATAQTAPPKVTNASIIELASHKADRLVTLKKIDGSFLTKMEKIELTLVQNQPPYVYKAVVSQTKPAQGLPLQLEVLFDKDGNALNWKLLPNGVAGPDLGWTGKNAITLTENSLHFVLENSTNTLVSPFFTDASGITLSKGTIADKIVSRAQITSYKVKTVLNVYLNLDGTLNKYEIQ